MKNWNILDGKKSNKAFVWKFDEFPIAKPCCSSNFLSAAFRIHFHLLCSLLVRLWTCKICKIRIYCIVYFMCILLVLWSLNIVISSSYVEDIWERTTSDDTQFWYNKAQQLLRIPVWFFCNRSVLWVFWAGQCSNHISMIDKDSLNSGHKHVEGKLNNTFSIYYLFWFPPNLTW